MRVSWALGAEASQRVSPLVFQQASLLVWEPLRVSLRASPQASGLLLASLQVWELLLEASAFL